MSNNPLVDSVEYVDSDKDTHFTDALTQHAVEEENIDFPSDWGTLQVQKCEISSISVLSDQLLDWEVQFYATDGHSNTDADTDSYITSITFNSSDGRQNASTGLYRYDANPAFLPFIYHDEDRTSEFHISLVNRSATAKASGGTGEVKLRIQATPIL
jgi:hypothetical protein